jgi:circadian clock protein KaiC
MTPSRRKTQPEPNPRSAPKPRPQLPKAPTGIQGLDEITGGGLPRGRPTLVCGDVGCGKTLLAMQFLVRGATEYDEPGVFLAFGETAEDLTENVASLDFDLNHLVARKKIVLDYVHIERSEIEQSGEYDLEGLFIRLGAAIDAIGARRVVLDTIESLFAGLPNPLILRAELRRLFCWLKDKGVTAIITGERGDNTLSRNGLEEYISDCVIVLDHRVSAQTSSRYLRVVKYRGSTHGTNEYPFLIDSDGISVLPITSLGLKHIASSERISTGIPRLDAMLAARATTAVAACWSPARRAPARAASPHTFPKRHAAAASASSTSPSRSPPIRSGATCVPSASTCNRGSRKGCCTFMRTAPPLRVWRCI